jgi:hypothetical protein
LNRSLVNAEQLRNIPHAEPCAEQLDDGAEFT